MIPSGRAIWVLWLALALTLFPKIAAAQSPASDDRVLAAYVDGIVGAAIRERGIPGVTVAIVQNGRPVLIRGYGEADLASSRRVDAATTRFRIGSLSKTFVWTAIMMLVDEGRINLNADVNRYLKTVKVPPLRGRPVTIADVMAHRGGFADSFAVYTHSKEPGIVLDVALRKDMPARVYAPGARVSYGNWPAALAAQIVSDVSGMPYQRFLATRVLAPLGMTATTLGDPQAMAPRDRANVALGYRMVAGQALPTDFMRVEPYSPIGGMVTTAPDMARWMIAHLADGAPLMRPAAHRLMLTRPYDPDPDAPGITHGFWARSYDGHQLYWHLGATAEFYSSITLVPDLNLGIFMSQNSSGDTRLADTLPSMVIDVIAGKRRSERATGQATLDAARRVAGTYISNRRTWDHFEAILALFTNVVVRGLPDGSVEATFDGRTRSFAPISGKRLLYEDEGGGRLRFITDARGSVVGLVDPNGSISYERVGLIDSPLTFFVSLAAAGLLSLSTLIAAWRGRHAAPTGHRAKLAIRFVPAGTSALFLAFLVAFGAAIMTLANFTPALLNHYPPAAVSLTRGLGILLTLAAVLLVSNLVPILRDGALGWRAKGHRVALALSIAIASALAIHWCVMFAPTA